VGRIALACFKIASLILQNGFAPSGGASQAAVAITRQWLPANHMGAMSRLHQVVFDWLDDTLAARRDAVAR
jgi:hypothetical protein